MDYDGMLDAGRKKLPESVLKTERFEVPRIRGHIQGNRTVLSNFYHIADVLGRKPEHLLKFVLKELAAPGELTKSAAIIGTKVSASRINQKIQQYSSIFVICNECRKPDTQLIKEEGFTFLKCLACGAKHIVRRRL